VKVEPGKNNHTIIRVPNDQELIKKVKTIYGRRWNPKEKYWEVTYNENLIANIQT